MQQGFLKKYTPFLLSIPLTLMIVLLFQVDPEKYQSVLFDRVPARFCYYIDLENDGEKELVMLGETPTGVLYIMLFDENDKLIGQFNLKYPGASNMNNQNAIICDTNGDINKEIIVFTQNKDSVLMNVFDYRSLSFILEDRYISRIGGLNKYNDFFLSELCFFDANEDGIQEFYFSIAAGFAIHPRRIFRYDFLNDSLIESINTGASYLHGESIVTGDDFHLLVSSSATGNIKPEHHIPFPDTCGWIFDFDKDLRLKSDPISIGTYPTEYIGVKCSQQMVYVYYPEGDNNMILMKSPEENYFSDSLKLESAIDYHVLNRYEYRGDTLYYFVNSLNSKNIIFPEKYVNKNNIYARFLNGRIPIVKEYSGKEGFHVSLLQNPISLEMSLLIKEKHRHELIISDIDMLSTSSTVSINSINSGKISVISENASLLYNYSVNPAYKLRYFNWLAVFLSINTVIFLTLYFQRRRFAKQSQLEKQVASLQLQNLRNQLDPHFTFNALNSVANAIFQEKKEDAYDLFQRFTRMIRSSLITPDEVLQSLEAELQFTTDYLEFQKTRFKGRFDYLIEIADIPDRDQIMLPRMIIQGFAENAVKHAFYKVDYKGIIRISATMNNNKVEITIEDNGIGIKQSKRSGATSGTQKGEKLLSDQIQQINKLKNTNIRFVIIDKADSGTNDSGTLVRILI